MVFKVVTESVHHKNQIFMYSFPCVAASDLEALMDGFAPETTRSSANVASAQIHTSIGFGRCQ